MSVCPPRI